MTTFKKGFWLSVILYAVIALLLIVSIASCRSVSKLSRQSVNLEMKSEIVRKDSTHDLKVDSGRVTVTKISEAVKIDSAYDNVTVTDEITEYQDGVIAKQTKKIVRAEKGNKTSEAKRESEVIDSASVGIIEHSRIVDESIVDSVKLVAEKVSTVDKTPSPIRFGYLILFFALCVCVGLYFKKKITSINPFS